MIYLVLAITVVYIFCGVLAYGLHFAYFQQKWPELAATDYEEDVRDALIHALAGPAGLLANLICCGTKYGLQYRYKEMK